MLLRFVDGLLLLAFIGVLSGVIGMELGGETKHLFKKIHEVSGIVFITTIFIHIWMHRKFLKTMIAFKKKNNRD